MASHVASLKKEKRGLRQLGNGLFSTCKLKQNVKKLYKVIFQSETLR